MTNQRSAISVQRSAMQPLAASRTIVRAFSLVEVLLAIFILGVGVISIAALFPAGIAQQRLSSDDMMGSIVANSAIEIIRGKVKPEDFGTFEEFDPDPSPSAPPALFPPRPTVPGDWTWHRPGFLFADDGSWPPAPAPPLDETGSIDIFSWYAATASGSIPATSRATEWPAGYTDGTLTSDPLLYGIPYNRSIYGTVPPRVIITREERYFPMASRMFSGSNEIVRPQYVWECAFRRYQGKILVAIFVYRVTVPGGGTAPNYSVAQNSLSPTNPFDPSIPPLPVALEFIDSAWADSNLDVNSGGPWDAVNNDAVVLGVEGGTAYNYEDVRHSWQQPRQWIIDQNNAVHRVLGQSREDDVVSNPVEVELVRPVTPVFGRLDVDANATLPTDTPYFYRPEQATWTDRQYRFIFNDIVTDIWYIPLVDGNDLSLTPVYATVKEL